MLDFEKEERDEILVDEYLEESDEVIDEEPDEKVELFKGIVPAALTTKGSIGIYCMQILDEFKISVTGTS